MAWRCGLFLCCALLCNSSAQNSKGGDRATWEPPATVDFPETVKASVPKEMITSLRVAGRDIVLDETALKAVQSDIGGTMGKRGDAHDALGWLCLRGGAARDQWVLWLMSGEMNGGSVGGFRWQRVDQATHFDSKCRKLPDGRRGVEFPLAVRLGMKQSQIIQILGQPSDRHGDILFYLHEHEVTLNNQSFMAANTLAVVLRKQVLWAIEAWKSTTD